MARAAPDGRAESPEFNLSKTIEALRAVREHDVSCEGLKALRAAMARPGRAGWSALISYLHASPSCSELTHLWEVQSTVKEQRVLPQLLLLLTDIVSAREPVEPEPPTAPEAPHGRRRANATPAGAPATAAAATAAAAAEERALVASAQRLLIGLALGRRLKLLYHCVGAERAGLANAAMALLAAVAAHSGGAARDMAAAFDWSLTALGRVCRPSRDRSDDKQDQQKQQPNRKGSSASASTSSSAAAWRHPNPLSRPRRAMFVAWARALLSTADSATLARLLPLRPLIGGLLHHIAADPPGQALETLALLGRRVLTSAPGGGAGGGGAALAPRLRAEPFGDAALTALADLAAATDEPVTPEVAAAAAAAASSAALEDAVAAPLAAEAALEVLTLLCTDPACGLAVPLSSDTAGGASASGADGGGGGGGSAAQQAPGVKRLLRLLPRLRPADRLRHGRLLGEVAGRCPWLAAEFASSMPYDLQPRVSARWVAVMSLAARLTAAAAGAPSPLVAKLAASSAAGAPPPSFESPAVRAHLRCCLPPALSKAVLSRGVQHRSPLVSALSLDCLAAALSAIRPLVQSAEAGAARAAAAAANASAVAAAVGSAEGPAAASAASAAAAAAQIASAWAGFLRRLGAAVRSRLPDLQTLLARHAALQTGHKGGAEAAGAAAAADGAEAKPAKKQKRGKGEEAEAGQGGAMDVDGPALEGDGEEAEGGEGEGEDGEDEGEAGAVATAAELAAAVFGAEAAADGAALASAVAVRLLGCLASYCRLLPEAVAEAHLDPLRLLPQDVLQLDEQHQLALLDLLAAAAGGGGGGANDVDGDGSSSAIGRRGLAGVAAAAAAAPLSTALVLPLLRLVTLAPSPAARAAAGDLLLRRLRPLAAPVAAAGEDPEASTVAGWAALELRVWLGMLPAAAPGGAAAAAGDGDANGGGSSASGGGPAGAVLGFFADLVVGGSRRPQDAYELTQGWLPPPPDVSQPGQPPRSPGCGCLPALALRNCLRLLRSRRVGREAEAERGAVAAYVAGVLHQLLQLSPAPEALVHLAEAALAADAASAADKEAAAAGAAAAAASGRAGKAAHQAEGVVTLPAEGRPLLALHEWAVQTCAARAAAVAAPGAAAAAADAAAEPPAPKRRRKSVADGGDERCAAAASSLPWGVGSLRLRLAAVSSAGGEDGNADESASKELRGAVKAAAKAVRAAAKAAAKAGQPPPSLLPPAAAAALAAAAPLASHLLTVTCADSTEAAAAAVGLLQLAAAKAGTAPTATPGGGSVGDDSGALTAALWAFVLAKPLAARCLGPADLLQLAAEGRLAAGSGGGDDEEEGGEGVDAAALATLLPSPAALQAVAGGAAGVSAWDATLPAAAALQVAVRHPQKRKRKAGGAALAAAVAAAGPCALAAAARGVAFWLPLLTSAESVSAALEVARRLLPATAAATAGAAAVEAAEAAARCGALCLVLRCPYLLGPRGSDGGSDAGGGGAVAMAVRQGGATLAAEALTVAADAGPMMMSWGPRQTAAVRAACQLHVDAAAAAVLAVLRGSEAATEAAAAAAGGEEIVAALLPLLRAAPPLQLLPLVEATLAAAPTPAGASANGGPASAGKAKKAKRASAAASGQPVQQPAWLLQAGLGLAASLLEPRLPAAADANAVQAAERQRLGRVFLAVQSVLTSAAAAAAEGDAAAAATAAVAAEALAAGLRGGSGHWLAPHLTPSALAACASLAPECASAADAAAAALELGPPALHAAFATALPAAVAAAEQRSPGSGRRVALARLLPAADAVLHLAEAADGDADSDGASASSAAAAVAAVFREPLLAYATRRRRRPTAPTAAAEAADAMPADAVLQLRRRAVGVLARIVRLQAGAGGAVGDDGGGASDLLHRTLPKLLPPPGAPYPLDEEEDDGDAFRAANGHHHEEKKSKRRDSDAVNGADTTSSRRLPVASAAEQLQAAAALLRAGVGSGDGGGGGDAGGDGGGGRVCSESDLAAVTAVLGAAAATLAALYGRGVLPSAPDSGTPAERRLLAAAAATLDGAVGDLLADTPDDLRASATFASAAEAAAPLVAATVAAAASDPAAVRCVRRLLAALLPAAAGAEEGDAEAGAGKPAGDGAGPEEAEESEEEEEATPEGPQAEEEEEGSEEDAEGLQGHVSTSSSSDSRGSHDSMEDSGSEDGDDGPAAAKRGAGEDADKEELEGVGKAEEGEDEGSGGEGEEEGGSGDEGAATDDATEEEDDEEEGADGAHDAIVDDEAADVELAEVEAPGPGALQLSYGVIQNAGVASAAAAMLEALVAAAALPAVFTPLTAAPALPPAVARMSLPLVSLLPLGNAAADVSSTAAADSAAGVSAGGAGGAGSVGLAEAAREELAVLLETLLDLRVSYDKYDEYGSVRQGRDEDEEVEDVDAGAGGAPFGRAAAERSALAALLSLLQCAYGGSLTAGDRAVLRCMLRLNELLTLAEAAEADGDGGSGDEGGGALASVVSADVASRRMAGPLARSGFLHGPAATAYYAAVAEAEAAAAASADGAATSEAALQRLRAAAVADNHPPDPRTMAVATVCFPACRTLAADEDDPWVSGGAGASRQVAAGAATAAAAADPAWVLPFAVAGLRDGTATAGDLSQWGVLPLCLRCLGSADVGLRTLAYEALAAAAAQLDQLAAAAAAAAAAQQAKGGPAAAATVALAGPAAVGNFLTGGSGGAAAAAAAAAAAVAAAAASSAGVARPPSDWRQRQQLQALLAHVRNAITAPLQQLPGLAALTAAEAAAVLAQPQASGSVRSKGPAPMYKPLTRLIGRRPALDLGAPPLLNRVMAAGAPGQRHEAVWALSVIRWGAQGRLDAGPLRRRFAAEVAMGAVGSAAAALDAGGGGSGGAGGVPLALATVCSLAAALPSIGRHLVLHAGFAPWLAGVAASAVRGPDGTRAAAAAAARQHAGAPLPPAAGLAVDTLLDLASRRVCLRKQDGNAAVLQYGQAVGVLASAATAAGSGALAAAACKLAAAVAAALPPWRARPLWRSVLTPAVLLRLYGAITDGGAASSAWMSDWLQAVVRSSLPAPAQATAVHPGFASLSLPGFPLTSSSGTATDLDADAASAVRHLIRTAVDVALALPSGSGGGSTAPPPAAGPGSLQLARGCLLWLAAQSAAGHSLCAPAAASPGASAAAGGRGTGQDALGEAQALSEAVSRLCARALQEEGGAAGGGGDGTGGGGEVTSAAAAAPACRLLLAAAAAVSRKLLTEAGLTEAAEAEAAEALPCAVACIQRSQCVLPSGGAGARTLVAATAPAAEDAAQARGAAEAAWLRAVAAAVATEGHVGGQGGGAGERWAAAERAVIALRQGMDVEMGDA
ncbi:hypothetical protein HYH03_002667 [Edaphochlamys debaryana]|uniref:Nucleolar pre-ribosomal-associated protein 1 N-terminal domain-containing protein n=1 Tax=Edaphochlamys debaryana TaxID=47281 RepID=A0A836C5E0_9CHLO|nr:hypothetical protein HYH03_002667 [Edaphochlamys debaryana]|eukprot:KAG2499734.1 hypothetical protein HYH03_002667 [Edaphochlamys debaryana]